MRPLFCLLSALALLGGCANYQEPGHINIVIGLAVDRGENGYSLTFEAVDLSGSPKDNEMDSFTVSAEGVTIPHALEDARRQTAYRLHYGNLETIVVHEDLAREEGLSPLLSWCVRDAEMRETAGLVISRAASAREVLSAGGADIRVSSYVLEHTVNPPDGRAGHTVRVPIYRAADMLNTPGKALVLPAVSVQPGEDGDDGAQGEGKSRGVIRLDGLAAFRGDRLTGYLEQERVPYYLCLLRGRGRHEFVLDAGGRGEALRVRDCRTRLTLGGSGADGLPSFHIAVSARAVRLSAGAPAEREAAERLTEELRRTLGIIRSELDADILALGYELYIRDREQWELLGDHWPGPLSGARIEVEGAFRTIEN
ncbi:MAG: hypothetical protein FWG93_04795 [Oscillospiraceae bacterium]|nr:hypothetical protein [Oscillospiraceae bacterium]